MIFSFCPDVSVAPTLNVSHGVLLSFSQPMHWLTECLRKYFFSLIIQNKTNAAGLCVFTFSPHFLNELAVLSGSQSVLSPVQVLSGCAIIVRGQPRGGPPPERQINLSNIRAGAMARRAAQSQPDTKDTPDEVSVCIPLCLFYVCAQQT